MRHLFTGLLLLLFCLPCSSKMRHLERKEDAKRNEYLIEKSKEVIMAFGSDYYGDYKEPLITDIKTFKETFKDDPVLKNKKLFGRKYYTVTYQYDPSVETLLYNYAAAVDIWADDGQPKEVRFGNGRGQNFYAISYRRLRKIKVKEADY